MMDASPLEKSPLPFLHLMQDLKHLPRTGWLRTIPNPESVASHSFRLAVLGMCAPAHLNREKCIFLGLCHDMAESVVGDIPTYSDVPKEEKYKLEYFGFRYIQSLVKPFNPTLAQELMDAWLEYEDGTSAEACWVREMDKFECMIQAHEYEQRTFGEKDLDEFQRQGSKIISPEGKALLEQLNGERSAHLSKRKLRLPVIFIADSAHQDWTVDNENYQRITLDGVIRERSEDPAYLHSEFLRECLKEKVPVPTSLAIGLLEWKINQGVDKKLWTLISGFPETMDSITEFERKVQKPNFTVYLSSPKSDATSSPGTELREHLASTQGYFTEVNCSSTLEETNASIKAALLDFINHTDE